MRVKGLLGAGRLVLAGVALLVAGSSAKAAGPRWVSGPPYFATGGLPIAWYTTHPLYYTDPGDLSASVNHAAADAMVARAAAVWNVPVASLVLAQGGTLDEHVTGSGITVAGTAAPVLPADVRSTNYQAKQIAVIYDTDGSVIDALLGAGGSDPSGCLQTGVVESVDAFGTNATIQHATLILNGRCTGAAPEKQLQMQYQLERAFGRVLGIGWSQTNDNVFTNSPVPTYNDALNWPIMHPIDVICGPYTYQCMPQPFTLRADDISSIAQLYFLWQGQGVTQAGKEDSLANGSTVNGYVRFPSGQGMEGVNVTVRRHANFSPVIEEWQTVSAVSGYSFRRQTGTALAGQDGSALSSIGTYEDWREGYWQMARVPIPATAPWQTLVVTTEPVNPLYTGPYALSTMASGLETMAPSGSSLQTETDITARYYSIWQDMTANDAVSDCHAGADGTEGAPTAMNPTGWWTGVLCGFGHSAWAGVTVKANRSLTMEVTALDETATATAVKAMPMVGVWRAADAMGQAPTVAMTPVAFNSFGVGMSSVTVNGTAGGGLRVAVVDQRGAGRPDFAYQARMLYADAIQPVNVGSNGGTVVISGTGFRAGNTVTVNGVAATVTSVTATSITAVAPTLRALGSTKALLATVAVRDVTTGGVTTMTSALGYGAPQQRLQVMTVPTGTVLQGKVASTPFAVQVLATDGVTPLANQTVTFAVTTGYATFGVCGAVSCTAKTNAQGVAATAVTPTTTGTVWLQASTSALSVSASMTVTAQPDTMTLLSAPTGTVTVGSAAGTMFAVRVMTGDGVTPRAGQTVSVTAANGAARLEACGAASCSLKTDASGTAATAVTPLVSGAISVTATSAAGTQAASFRAGQETMALVSAPAGPVMVGTQAATMFAVRVIGVDGVTPMMGEAVQMSVTAGSALLGGCGSGCAVMTDANGLAAIPVTPTTAGAVTVQASSAAGAVSASLTATARPNVLQVVQSPSGMVYAGDALTPGVSVRLLLADGTTPVAGQPIRFAIATGAATLGSCGGASCTATTDANGMATMSVTPTAAGTVGITIEATGSQTTAMQSVSLTVGARQRAVAAVQPVVYVAEGVAMNWTAQVMLSDNSASTSGVPVLWTGSTGLQFGAAGSMTNGSVASVGAQVAGLGAGVRMQGTACAWGSVCATIAAEGVSAAAWQVQSVSGAGQQVSAGGAMQPVVLRVVDGLGHPVMGATVTLYQAVTAKQQACSGQGRCPAAPVLNTATSQSVSDASGLVTLPGSRVLRATTGGGEGTLTEITAVAGTQGVMTLAVEMLP